MPDSAAWAAHDRLARLESGVVADVTRALDAELGAIADHLRARAPVWRTDPDRERVERRALARRLRGLRPSVSGAVKALLLLLLLPLDDPVIRRVLVRVDALVAARARVAAGLVETTPLRTDRQVQVLALRIIAVGAPAASAASVAVVRAVETSSRRLAVGSARVWVARPGCCVHCAERSGAVSGPDGRFGRRVRLTDRPLPWAVGAVDGPPLHDHCRCVTVPATPGLAEAVARAVASASPGYVSDLQKARIARRILRSRAPLTITRARRARGLARRAQR